jgi:hypothetical protein
MELLEHPFITGLPQNDFHVSIQVVKLSHYTLHTQKLTQEINTIFTDRLLICRIFRKVHPTLGSEFLTAYHEVLQILRMKRHNLSSPKKSF